MARIWVHIVQHAPIGPYWPHVGKNIDTQEDIKIFFLLFGWNRIWNILHMLLIKGVSCLSGQHLTIRRPSAFTKSLLGIIRPLQFKMWREVDLTKFKTLPLAHVDLTWANGNLGKCPHWPIRADQQMVGRHSYVTISLLLNQAQATGCHIALVDQSLSYE